MDVGDAGESLFAFRILSFRSVIAFCTLFCRAAALYMNRGRAVSSAMLYALFWGFAAMVIVALLFYWMRGMAETGSPPHRNLRGDHRHRILRHPGRRPR